MREKLLEENTIIVLDTNVYLDIYRYSPDVREQYFKILKNKNIIKILFLTKTILSELMKNRIAVMKGTESKFEVKVKDVKNTNIFSSLKKKLSNMKRLGFPNIEKLEKELEKTNKEINNIFENYLDNHQDILEQLDDSFKNIDMVKEIMDIIINEKRVINGFEIEEIYRISEEGERRFKDKIAPGYGDEKNKQGLRKYNDLIIWEETVKYCKDNKKNLIYVTGDMKEWDEIGSEKEKKFPENMLNEFKSKTKQSMVGLSFENFIEIYCEEEGISKPNGLNYIMKLRKNEDIQNILEEIEKEIDEKIFCSGENCIDVDTLSNYDGSYFEINEIEKIELLEDKIDVDGHTIEYFLEFYVKINAESRRYIGKEDGEIMYSEKTIHLLHGKVSVYVVREVKYYLEIEDIKLDTIEIKINSLTEYDSYSEEDLCVSCGKRGADYDFNGVGKICADCMVSDGEGEVCPQCGEKYSFDDMAGDGFCIDCSRDMD